MAKRVILSFLMIFTLASCTSASGQKIKLYTRSDCIVQVIFDQKPIISSQWYSLTMDIGEISRSADYLHRYANIADIASRFQETNNAQSIYIQYFRDCGNKISMTKDLMKYFERKIPNLPPYRVLENKIKPNPKTIDVCGRFWSDCSPSKNTNTQ